MATLGERAPATGPARPPFLQRYREGLTAGLFLAPNALGFLVFTAIPVAAAVALSFLRWDLVRDPAVVGTANYQELLTDDVFRSAMFNTIYFVVFTVPLSVGLGLVAALLTHQAFRGATVFRSIFLLPYVTLTVAVALVWKWLYHPRVGLFNEILAAFGIEGPNWLTDSAWAMPALILLSVWKAFGFNMVLYLAGLQNIPRHLLEAAMVDGASTWRRFWHVTFPLLSPTTFFAVIISTIASFQVFDQALVMTGGGPGVATTTLVLYIYQAGFQSYSMGYAATIAVAMFAAVFVFTLVMSLLQRRWVTYE